MGISLNKTNAVAAVKDAQKNSKPRLLLVKDRFANIIGSSNCKLVLVLSNALEQSTADCHHMKGLEPSSSIKLFHIPFA